MQPLARTFTIPILLPTSHPYVSDKEAITQMVLYALTYDVLPHVNLDGADAAYVDIGVRLMPKEQDDAR